VTDPGETHKDEGEAAGGHEVDTAAEPAAARGGRIVAPAVRAQREPPLTRRDPARQGEGPSLASRGVRLDRRS
jgi:hypothetical protein